MRASSRVRVLASVNIATRSPRPTAIIGCPKKIIGCIAPPVILRALATVLMRIKIIGRMRGINDSRVPGTPVMSMLNAAS